MRKKRQKKELLEEMKLKKQNGQEDILQTQIIGQPGNKKIKNQIVSVTGGGYQTEKVNAESRSPKKLNKVRSSVKRVNKELEISTMAKEALERGGGRACVATHENGCRHYGILDLHGMDAKTYGYYTREGEWLNIKKCCGCQLNTKDMTLDKGSKYFVRYCEMGLKGYKYSMKGDNAKTSFFEDHNCDMILCIKCWNRKVEDHEKEIKEKVGGTTKKRCSARKKF